MERKRFLKLEILILTEPNLTDEEILKWAKMAMTDFCDFDEAKVRITDKYERLVVEVEREVEA